jgi:hypothetical protein
VVHFVEQDQHLRIEFDKKLTTRAAGRWNSPEQSPYRARRAPHKSSVRTKRSQRCIRGKSCRRLPIRRLPPDTWNREPTHSRVPLVLQSAIHAIGATRLPDSWNMPSVELTAEDQSLLAR